MSKYFLLSALLVLSTFSAHTQVDAKYLAGAVPEVDGKVVFTRTITPENNISESVLFDLLNQWVKNNYGQDDSSGNRILLSDPQTKEIACRGQKELVFKRSALSLDKTTMHYQLTLEIENNKCVASVRNIRYEYDFGKDRTAPAEEVISDEYALNKKKDKLTRYYSKFRTHSVDSIESIFTSIDVYLNGTKARQGAIANTGTTGAAVAAATLPIVIDVSNIQPITQNESSSAQLAGYKNIAPDRIPGNIIKLLSDWTLITSGTDEQTNVMTASWGGLGVFWEKPVTFCFLNPTRYSVTTMDKGETYTISFYTEAYKDALKYCGSNSGRNTDKIKGSGLTPIKLPSGATAFSEAWMIFECKKIVAQPLSPDAVMAKDLNSNWTKDGYHKMYIGEILNVWVK